MDNTNLLYKYFSGNITFEEKKTLFGILNKVIDAELSRGNAGIVSQIFIVVHGKYQLIAHFSSFQRAKDERKLLAKGHSNYRSLTRQVFPSKLGNKCLFSLWS